MNTASLVKVDLLQVYNYALYLNGFEPGHGVSKCLFEAVLRELHVGVLERKTAYLRCADVPEKLPLPLLSKPSIAVLPFDNMGEDKAKNTLAKA